MTGPGTRTTAHVPAFSRRRDILYRTGLMLQVAGAAVLAILYPLENPFYTLGIMLFECGVFLSALCLLVRISWIKAGIVGSVAVGLALQVAGAFLAPEQQAGSVIVAGIGFVCAGAAGMAANEAYYSGFYEGWFLTAVFPIMILGNLFGKEHRVMNAAGFSTLFLLLLFLAGRRLRQRLPSSR